MVRFIFQVLVTIALVANSISAQLDFEQLKEYATGIKGQFTNNATDPPAGKRPVHGLLAGLEFGGTNNGAYTYTHTVEPGEVVRGVTIHTGKRFNDIGIIHQNREGEPVTHFVTGSDANAHMPMLGPGEYITSIEAHTGKKDGRKRISFITTNKDNSTSGGTRTDDIGKQSAPVEGYQIGGFSGRPGDEIDSVAAIWATILP